MTPRNHLLALTTAACLFGCASTPKMTGEPVEHIPLSPERSTLVGDEENATVAPGDAAFTAPLPGEWTATVYERSVRFATPDGGGEMFVTRGTSGPLDNTIANAWKTWGKEMPEPSDISEIPGDETWEQRAVANYPRSTGSFQQAITMRHDGHVYVVLVSGSVETFQKRGAQLNTILSGITPNGAKALDLSGASAELTAAELAEWTRFVEEQIEASGVPGASVALVVDGKVVHAQGYGVRRMGGEPMKTSTRMMIGSTTKPMTTLLMASAVERGEASWETPVVEVMEKFRVKDPERTKAVQMQHLVCACTGVPRRDLELFFPAHPTTAEQVVDSLETFEFFTDFGETFQYSNQMVALGGFAAAAAAGSTWGELGPGYARLMNERVFAPAGMSRTTLSFDEATADADSGTPHRANLAGVIEPIGLENERFVEPVAPAGAIWSTADDMATFTIALMNGVGASGEALPGASQREAMWTQRTALSATSGYGLGWFVEDHHGVRVVSHGGNTIGFTSHMSMIPSAKVALVVLSNGGGMNAIGSLAEQRLFELMYERPERAAKAAEMTWGNMKAAREAFAGKAGDVDPGALSAYVGSWTNDALGDVELVASEGGVDVVLGEMRAPLKKALEGPHGDAGYLFGGGLLMGLPIRLLTRDDGPAMIIGEGAVEYTFTRTD